MGANLTYSQTFSRKRLWLTGGSGSHRLRRRGTIEGTLETASRSKGESDGSH